MSAEKGSKVHQIHEPSDMTHCMTILQVADFGMARDLGIETRIKSNKYGTITHCPPELILEGTVSKVW